MYMLKEFLNILSAAKRALYIAWSFATGTINESHAIELGFK